jgi:hypothetical protein
MENTERIPALAPGYERQCAADPGVALSGILQDACEELDRNKVPFEAVHVDIDLLSLL